MRPDEAPSLPPFDPAVLAVYPAEIGKAAAAFAETRALSDLRNALHGLLRYHQIKSPEGTPPLDPATAPSDTLLLGGLSLDSLSIAELAFLLEDLWGVHMENDTLQSLQTLDDLEALLAKQLGAIS